MTLILSAIAPSWAMQASDRKVTVLNRAGNVVDRRNERNKAIFVAERMTFAYTGHADIGGKDTAEWFQAQLGRGMSRGRSPDEALAEAVEMTEQYYRSLPSYTEDRTHAFVGVGWTDEDVALRRPFIVCYSNAIGTDGRWLDDPQDDFRTHRETLDSGRELALFFAGARLPAETPGHTAARIASHLDGSDDPAPVARILIEVIREAAEDNSDIGKGVMVNSLPRAPGPPTGDVMLVGGLPEPDVRTFTYVPEGMWEGRYLGPLVVGSDGSQMGNFVAEGTEITPDGGSSGVMYRPGTAPAPPGPRTRAVGQRVNEYKYRRNDPCWCGSGKKYKRCHGAKT